MSGISAVVSQTMQSTKGAGGVCDLLCDLAPPICRVWPAAGEALARIEGGKEIFILPAAIDCVARAVQWWDDPTKRQNADIIKTMAAVCDAAAVFVRAGSYLGMASAMRYRPYLPALYFSASSLTVLHQGLELLQLKTSAARRGAWHEQGCEYVGACCDTLSSGVVFYHAPNDWSRFFDACAIALSWHKKKPQ